MMSLDTLLAKIILTAFTYPKTLAFFCLLFLTCFSYIFYFALKKQKSLLKAKERLKGFQEALEAMPDGYYLWFYDAVGFIRETRCSRRLAVMFDLPRGTSSSFDALLERFSPQDAELLSRCMADMRLYNRPFSIEIQNHIHSGTFMVAGFRSLSSRQAPELDIIWVRDVTAIQSRLTDLSNQTNILQKQNEILRQSFNCLPFPIWLRNEDLQISICNTAYAKAVHADSPEHAVILESELVYEKSPREAKVLAASARAAGKERKAREFVVMNGKRHWVEVSEIPLPTQDHSKSKTIGFIRDITREQELQDSLTDHVSSHNGVLEHLKTAIAIFDGDARLQFYNTSFMNLWDLEPEWLDGSPTYSNFLDTVREKRRLPENRDYRAYKNKELKYFTSLVSATEDTMHLPSGITLRRMLTPHPLGGLMITYEDVTGHLTMERSMTILNETQYTVVNHLREAILLFGNDGRLRLANDAYMRLWEVAENNFNAQPLTVLDVIEKQKPFFEADKNWDSLREQLLGVITSHTGEIFQVLRPDGKVLEFVAAPLPDGGIFVSFLDVTEEEKSSSIAEEKDSLLSRFKQTTLQADRLRAVFLEQLGQEMQPQLTILSDSAEKLINGKNQRLMQWQKRYLQTILDTSFNMKDLLDNMIDLALIETGSAVLELDSVDVSSILNSVANAVKEQIKQKAMILEVSIPKNPPPLIADKKRLRQVLYYLLSNAVSAGFKDGTVILAAKKEKPEDLSYLTISVTESSLDIKTDVDSVNFAAQSGFAGALITNLIEMHGGKIEISDKKGVKKTKIFLPIHQKT